MKSNEEMRDDDESFDLEVVSEARMEDGISFKVCTMLSSTMLLLGWLEK